MNFFFTEPAVNVIRLLLHAPDGCNTSPNLGSRNESSGSKSPGTTAQNSLDRKRRKFP
jgi:hypothetical protein